MRVVALPFLFTGLSWAASDDPPLMDAVRRGDVTAVRSLSRQGRAVDARSSDGSTALHWAAHLDDAGMVDVLLRAGADAAAENRYGITPIWLAAENGSSVVIDRLLQAGADARTRVSGGETVLMTAARAGNPEAVRVLVRHGANVNAREETRGQTALMWAASRGNVDVIKVLLEAGADIRARSRESVEVYGGTYVAGRRDSSGSASERLDVFTPLLFAVSGGHLDVARSLIASGASVHDIAPDGSSALAIACANAHWELASYLLDVGADPNAVNTDGVGPLHVIAKTRTLHHDVLSGGLPPPVGAGDSDGLVVAGKLIAAGAEIDAQTRGSRETALAMASKPADAGLVRLLLSASADPFLKNADGVNALMAASGVNTTILVGDDEEALEAVRMLLDYGVDVNDVDNEGNIALHGAAFRGYVPLVRLLVDRGANLEAMNRKGWTPVMTAYFDYRASQITTRPEALSFLRETMTARGLTVGLPSREEAFARIVNAPPSITCPDSQTVVSPDGRGVHVSYQPARATGRYRSTVTCTPASGTVFPIGTTTVMCTAVDVVGRTDACGVLMRIQSKVARGGNR